jgi:[ribosomal protein S5]-alanine N-acetyltransferase
MSGAKWRLPLVERLVSSAMGPEVQTQRMMLRPLRPSDFLAWQEVRRRCAQWLQPWEPARPSGTADAVEVRRAFDARCEQRDRERTAGLSTGFGMFVDGRFAGECNLNNITRGAQQGANVGYWIDERFAGQSLMPEAVVGSLAYSFGVLGLHRLEICIVPRNAASRRVVEKLGVRSEGVALRFLEINGVWEDHVRYAITADEWAERETEFTQRWLIPPQQP